MRKILIRRAFSADYPPEGWWLVVPIYLKCVYLQAQNNIYRLFMKHIFRISPLALVFALLVACGTSEKQFTIEGNVSGADGQTLYLDHSSLAGLQLADSARLGADGHFSFKGSVQSAPEFYRLRLGNQVLNVVVDSTETVKISAAAAQFATGYTVENSPANEQLKQLNLKLADLQGRVDALTAAYQGGSVLQQQFADSLTNMILKYKDEVKHEFVYTAPYSAAAYQVLFQQVGQYMMFDPYTSPDDVKVFATVATSYQAKYPDSDRSKNLSNIVLKGMRDQRKVASQNAGVSEDRINETGIIDVTLRDIDGRERNISDLKGQVVVIDFTAYQTEMSASHNMALNELYTKYHSQGLEIYQISFDENEHFWKTAADNLPWICVRDVRGAYSPLPQLYNVQALPAVFVVNRNNELSARVGNLTDLETVVRQQL